jgi:hypothetical protein
MANFTMKGSDLFDSHNHKVAAIRGSDVYDDHNKKIWTMNDVKKGIDGAMGGVSVVALWLFFAR